MHSEDKVPKRCFLVQDQPNSFPIPPVIPPMRGMLPAGFCPAELFLEQKNISLPADIKTGQLHNIIAIIT